MTQSLLELVRTFPDSATPQEIFANLSNKDQTAVDPEKHAIDHLVRLLGRGSARNLLGKLTIAAANDPLLRAGLARLENEGLNFANPDVQAMVDDLVAAKVLKPSEGDALKAIGIYPTSRLDRAGLSYVQLEDVVQAQEDLRYRRDVLQPLVDLYNACIVLAETGELTTAIWEQHAAIVAAGLRNWG